MLGRNPHSFRFETRASLHTCHTECPHSSSRLAPKPFARYKLPIIVCVMNNGGIYGGDRREAALAQAATQGAKAGGFAADPAPTSFVDGSR